jgi:hypothetical protein
VAQSSVESRSARLLRACDDAIDRLGAKERAGTDPDTFAELGEALFWLFALAEANGRDSQGLLLGIKWARNRIAHGVVMAAPGPVALRCRDGGTPGANGDMAITYVDTLQEAADFCQSAKATRKVGDMVPVTAGNLILHAAP